MSMYSYVVTSQKPTAVQHAVMCSFTSPGARNLIIGRGNHLEIKTFNSETNELSVELEVSLNGVIASLNPFRMGDSTQDVLFVLTDHKHICILSYDAQSKRLVTKATGNCKDRIGRELECGVTAVVDPENRYICLMLYEGLLKVKYSFLVLNFELKNFLLVDDSFGRRRHQGHFQRAE